MPPPVSGPSHWCSPWASPRAPYLWWRSWASPPNPREVAGIVALVCSLKLRECPLLILPLVLNVHLLLRLPECLEVLLLLHRQSLELPPLLFCPPLPLRRGNIVTDGLVFPSLTLAGETGLVKLKHLHELPERPLVLLPEGLVVHLLLCPYLLHPKCLEMLLLLRWQGLELVPPPHCPLHPFVCCWGPLCERHSFFWPCCLQLVPCCCLLSISLSVLAS